MTDGDHEPPRGQAIQAWSDRGMPLVVYAAPPEAEMSATRGITGVAVLLILFVGVAVAVWQFYGALTAYQRYTDQQRITEMAEGLQDYVEALEDDNEALRTNRRFARQQSAPVHFLQEVIQRDRADYATRCARVARNEGGAYCAPAVPPAAQPSPLR
ncbi:MAG: hypothetical protein AB7O98_19155 [Hyphomonadaceae bacterium]